MKDKKENPVAKKLLTVAGLSEYLSIPPGSIYVKVCKNQLPGVVRIGKSLRFNKEDIDSWLENLKEAPPSANT